MKRHQEKRGKQIPQNSPKPGLKLLEILLRGKEKQTFRWTTFKIEKARKDRIDKQA
jgi:hypothetical protein